jgi:DNA polymerase
MKFVTGDAETFFDRKNKYSLSVMTQEEYLRDPKFEMHGIALKWGNVPAKWYDEKEWRYICKEEDWSDVFFLAHHNAFDASILNWHYGIKPAMLGCTMSMGKLLLGAHISVSLDSMRKHFGIPAKVTPYGLFDGKRWSELTPDVRELVADGAVDEVESIYKMFTEHLAPEFPVEEYTVVDMIIRMFSEPVIRLDGPLLAKVWQDEALKKQNLLQQLGLRETDLQSADKFAELLRAEGIEPEMKPGIVSKKTGRSKDNYAFAAKDNFMRELLESDNEKISTLASARVGVKSTITQTRAESLGWIYSRGPCPFYLNYAGAGTLRVVGGGSINPLNFKRNSDIRRSICAPEGFVLAPVDSSQIEARCLNYLAGQWDVIERFREGKDPYTAIATQFYGEEIYKPAKGDPRKAEMEMKRGTGKQAELSCGYGSSGETF